MYVCTYRISKVSPQREIRSPKSTCVVDCLGQDLSPPDRSFQSLSRRISRSVRVQSVARGIMAKLMTNFVNNPSFAKLFPSGFARQPLLAIFFSFSAECLFMKFRDYREGESKQSLPLSLSLSEGLCHNGAQQTFTNDAAPSPDIFYRTWYSTLDPPLVLLFSLHDLQRFRCLTFSSVKCYPRGFDVRPAAS